MSALTVVDVVVAQRATTLSAEIETLLRRAALASGLPHEEPVGALPELGPIARWQHLLYPHGCWAVDEGATPELLLWPSDAWAAGNGNQPVLGAGFTFVAADAPPVSTPQRAAHRSALARAGVVLGQEGPALRCMRTRPLACLVTEGSSLDDQARALGEWARLSLDLIATISPVATSTRK